jgi:phosphoribosylformylglycinamidine synthase
MAMASNVGIEVYDLSGDIPTHYWGFGEYQGRYIIVTSQDRYVIDECKLSNVTINRIGKACGRDFIFGSQRMSVGSMKEKNEAWLPNYMA